MPLTFARMQKSGTAAAYGLDNTIPAALQARARGLAIVGGDLEALGLIVTSVYRSPVVNAVLYFIERNPGQSPDVASLPPRMTTHAQARALDLGVRSSGLSPAELRARLEASAHAGIVSRVIDEGDHLHVEFDASALEALDDGVRT